MSQGLRGRLRRLACLSFGVVICSGVVGCMGDKKSPLSTKTPPPGLPGTPLVNGAGTTARPGQPTQPNSTPNGFPSNGTPTGAMSRSSGSVPPGGSPTFGSANPNNFGTINSPTLPGTVQPTGYNQPNSVVPSVTPTSSVMPNPRTVAMATPPAARGQGPELPAMTDLGGPIPPAQPMGPLPSVAPSNYYAPVSPPSPAAPVAPPLPTTYPGQ